MPLRQQQQTPAGPVRVDADGPVVAISVHGPLDDATGLALVDVTRAALENSPERIDIDLRAVLSHTDSGAAALVACRDLGASLPDGLHYRTATGPGGDALLAAFDGTV